MVKRVKIRCFQKSTGGWGSEKTEIPSLRLSPADECGEHSLFQMPAAGLVPLAYLSWNQVVFGVLPSFSVSCNV